MKRPFKQKSETFQQKKKKKRCGNMEVWREREKVAKNREKEWDLRRGKKKKASGKMPPLERSIKRRPD